MQIVNPARVGLLALMFAALLLPLAACQSTDTGDADGAEIERQAVPAMSAAEWQAVLEGFLGESTQVPPMYSALKKEGKRLYELARQGLTVERESRPVRIDSIELLEAAGTRLVFRVRCSKGTYIRVLAEDIARSVGTIAHTSRLHREEVGDFRSEDMLELGALEAVAEEGQTALKERLMSPDVALAGLPAVTVGAGDDTRFCGGQAVSGGDEGTEGLVRVYGHEDRFLGVGELSGNGRVAPRRVFLTSEENS